ncbi:MAG: hypothetical protein WC438_01760 [Candidatus Pacearchaeota archaeon]
MVDYENDLSYDLAEIERLERLVQQGIWMPGGKVNNPNPKNLDIGQDVPKYLILD